jgi:glycogen debranching enzyme
MARQPFLHDLLIAHSAPTQAWAGPDGQVRPGGVAGWYHSDVRVLSRVEVTLGGEEPETVAAGPDGTGRIRVIAMARAVDSPDADPTVRLTRTLSVTPGRITERIEIDSALEQSISAPLVVRVATDLASMEEVKTGKALPVRTPVALADGQVAWDGGAISVALSAPGATVTGLPDGTVELTWNVEVPARGKAAVEFEVSADDALAAVRAPQRREPEWSVPSVRHDDPRAERLARQALADLEGLRMSTVDSPDDVFLAAGAPWFFTLFGRDSLIAARFLLPLTTAVAAGTLRTLARRQGTVTDPATAEQPGKILHEVRRAPIQIDDVVTLPPLYYGTIDATALWISLLHDAWRAGMPADEVAALSEPLEAALGWLRDHGTVDGFISYIDSSGQGLTNQGWKDSGDSVQFRDGTLAQGPIALVEVQAYAHRAALDGAALLDAHGRDGDPWRAWAADLGDRFRDRFWAQDGEGRYLVIALDGAGRQVDTVTSNMGHVLGSGLLTSEEAAQVVARLVDPAMSSGYGLRTLSSDSTGYFPTKYHGGSVWPHDTAVAIEGLLAEGFEAEARTLAKALLDAAEDFDFRLPELFAGDAKGEVPRAVPYPASCRPQAWAAASVVPVLRALDALER